MKADDLRELKRAVKAVKGIARDMAEMFGPSPKDTVRYIPPHTNPDESAIPPNYSFVQCDACGSPGVLLRDSNGNFGAACLHCRTITHLESIIEEKK